MRRISLAALLALGLAACEDVGGTDTTRLTILLTDAPGEVTEAVVTISEIYLQGGSDSTSASGRVVLRSEPVTTDLLTLVDDVATLVDSMAVPSGSYSQLRFVIEGAYLTVEGTSGPLVYATNLESEFIEFLRPQTIIGKFGAKVFPVPLRRSQYRVGFLTGFQPEPHRTPLRNGQLVGLSTDLSHRVRVEPSGIMDAAPFQHRIAFLCLRRFQRRGKECIHPEKKQQGGNNRHADLGEREVAGSRGRHVLHHPSRELTAHRMSKEDASRVGRMDPVKPKRICCRSRILQEVCPVRECNPCTSMRRVCTSPTGRTP